MKQQILAKLAEISALQTSYNAKYGELLSLVQSLPDEAVNTPSFRDKFISFYKGGKYEKGAIECFDLVAKALKEIGIYSDLVMVGAMSTVLVEVGLNFKPIEEYASGEAYEGRLNLGNTQPGDGVRFKGRGILQLTGRFNYTKYSSLVGVDLVANPQRALEPEISAKVLAWYFKDKGCDKLANNKDWLGLRKAVNGVNKATGLPNGWEKFNQTVKEYLN